MKLLSVIMAIALLCLPVAACADEDQAVDKPAVKVDGKPPVKAEVKAEVKTEAKAAAVEIDKVAPEKEITIAEYLVGVWDMAPTKYIPSGDFTFNADGTYEKNERDAEGGGAGMKGEYKLYPDLKPCGIDICLDKCGVSEWTTMFGIVRILDDGRVEIQTSPDSNRPTAFSEEPDEMYTKLLTRRVVKE